MTCVIYHLATDCCHNSDKLDRHRSLQCWERERTTGLICSWSVKKGHTLELTGLTDQMGILAKFRATVQMSLDQTESLVVLKRRTHNL